VLPVTGRPTLIDGCEAPADTNKHTRVLEQMQHTHDTNSTQICDAASQMLLMQSYICHTMLVFCIWCVLSDCVCVGWPLSLCMCVSCVFGNASHPILYYSCLVSMLFLCQLVN
jgi:preprotein translocase subunit SecF